MVLKTILVLDATPFDFSVDPTVEFDGAVVVDPTLDLGVSTPSLSSMVMVQVNGGGIVVRRRRGQWWSQRQRRGQRAKTIEFFA